MIDSGIIEPMTDAELMRFLMERVTYDNGRRFKSSTSIITELKSGMHGAGKREDGLIKKYCKKQFK